MTASSSTRKRYALVGTGGRCAMFLNAIADPKAYAEYCELVGLCDLSHTRMNYWSDRLNDRFGLPATPCYHADDFDRMITETRPDVVIVTTIDSTHHTYIIRAMELGCDVICEKPITTDEVKAQAILDAQARTGRDIRVTFNVRYMPAVTQVRKLILEGAIGTPLLVDLQWTLNTSHGADYFRRWHREKDKSGGLLIHKSTHHFDMVNFWVGSVPQWVAAFGELKFYGRKNAEARGEHYSYERYTGAEEARNDPFALTLDEGSGDTNDTLRKLYLEAEEDSGYIRDRNVFGDNITAEDTVGLLCRYENGVQFNYSLVAYSPWEGFRAAITGTKGRLELFTQSGSHIITGQDDTELAAAQSEGKIEQLTVFPMFKPSYEVPIEEAEGGHGGADPIILNQLFSPNPMPDPFNRGASHVDGIASMLLGLAANRSIEQGGQPIQTASLVQLPAR